MTVFHGAAPASEAPKRNEGQTRKRRDRPTKAELRRECADLGIEAPEDATNAALSELIAKAQGGVDADAPAFEDEA